LDLFLSSEQKLFQKISPAMFQSLNILQMNVADLRNLVLRECEKNPAVEPIECGKLSSPGRREDFSDIKAEQSMEEYILCQVPEWPDSKRAILATILKNLDEKGFFAGKVSAIAVEHGVPSEIIGDVLDELKTLKPYGIGAKDLPEALLVQLDNIPGIGAITKKKTERIIGAHLCDLLRGSLRKIAKEENMALEDVKAIGRLVSRLRFSPLSFFERDVALAIIPDVRFFRRSGEWIVEVNDTYYPQLRFSGTYKSLLVGHSDLESVKYLKNQAKSARLLTRAIFRRKDTLLKIAQSILEHQMQFFTYGQKWLKRLSMGEIAEDISINVSTVSRAISGKYAETPHGTFKMSVFFESGVRDCSATFIKTEMKNLILTSRTHLSDEKIASVLGERGIEVSRRTIAKYRKQENLPNSRVRKIS
jgi:RNA polymerase sigma-54 factor